MFKLKGQQESSTQLLQQRASPQYANEPQDDSEDDNDDDGDGDDSDDEDEGDDDDDDNDEIYEYDERNRALIGGQLPNDRIKPAFLDAPVDVPAEKLVELSSARANPRPVVTSPILNVEAAKARIGSINNLSQEECLSTIYVRLIQFIAYLYCLTV